MLKEEPYLLADHWSRVLEDTYVSDWGSITIVYLDDVNQTSSVVGVICSVGIIFHDYIFYFSEFIFFYLDMGDFERG